MTHPTFGKDIFVETACEHRFQAMLRSALHKRSWHVIVADPGSGKTMGIRDLVRTTGSPAILAVTAPKNNESEQAIGNQLFAALGLSLRGRWSERKPILMGSMVQFGVKCLIVDDAHDLSLEHLMFIKELTDQGRLHHDYPLGLCLVAAGRGNTIPLKEILDQTRRAEMGRNPNVQWSLRVTWLTPRRRRKNRYRHAKTLNVHFLGWFQSNSRVFWTVASRWLNVLTVQARAHSRCTRE
jgi:AAA domain